MVKSVTSLARNGLRDWLIQHISAAVVGAYVIFLAAYILFHGDLTFAVWHALFAHPAMKVWTVVVMLGVILHAYIGMWTISTDYLKATAIRLLFQFVVLIALLSFLIWGIMIVWSV
jgi:succinate dehydrogenase / fumarate reductase, membrane anchor subunit